MAYQPLSGQNKVTSEWQSMAGEWDDMASGYRDAFVKVLWQETGYTDANSRQDLVVLDFGCATGLLAEAIRNDIQRYIGIEVADQMLAVFQDKIKQGDWDNNIETYCAALAHLDQATPEVQKALESLQGKVDIIAASSVLSFIPEEDIEATMKVLGSFLKPGTGILVHTDWPKSDSHPDGFTEEKAKTMYYEKAGLQAKTTKQVSISVGGQDTPVFVGSAIKSSE